jgi:hypothetical protein
MYRCNLTQSSSPKEDISDCARSGLEIDRSRLHVFFSTCPLLQLQYCKAKHVRISAYLFLSNR